MINKTVIPIALIAALGFAVYANSLNGKFVWDDKLLVRDNVYIRNPSRIAKVFTEGIGSGGGIKAGSYRPLQMLTYMAEYPLWKLDVRGYHFTNMLFHILAALGVWGLLNLLYGNRSLSLFAGILFVIHPLHTGAVSYISGRADPMAALFMLLSFIFYIKHDRSRNAGFYILAILSYIFALFSRENSLILPAFFLLYHFTFKRKLAFRVFAPVLGVTLAYIFLRITALSGFLPRDLSNITLFQRIPGFFVAVLTYIRLLFFPFDLHMEYGNKLFTFANPQAFFGALILAFLLIYALKKRNRGGLIFFSISWFFIALLPVSNLYPINAYMAEHWLYLPSIGFFTLLGGSLDSLRRRSPQAAVAIITILVGFYSFLTIRQNSYWKEPIAFSERQLKYAPESFGTYNDLGSMYDDLGRHEEAIALFEKALEINPDYVEAYNNLGIAYYDTGRKDEAIALYKKAIDIEGDYPKSYYNLGLAHYNAGRPKDAISAFKKAVELNPDYVMAHYNLGIAHWDIGEKDKAIASFKKAIEIDPTYARAYNNLGALYQSMGKAEEAIIFYTKAIEINPNYKKAQDNLRTIYKERETGK